MQQHLLVNFEDTPRETGALDFPGGPLAFSPRFEGEKASGPSQMPRTRRDPSPPREEADDCEMDKAYENEMDEADDHEIDGADDCETDEADYP